jgi:secondary thiamine-phosphate synthase enzyme
VSREEGATSVKHLFENHDLETSGCGDLIDVTADVRGAVGKSGVQNGVAVVYTPHTTCTVLINERESGFMKDFQDRLDQLVPAEGPYYRHDDLSIRTEGLEDDPHEFPNGHSHCRAALIGAASQSIPIVDGNLLLGRYQSVFFCELDRAKPRKVFIQVMGE